MELAKHVVRETSFALLHPGDVMEAMRKADDFVWDKLNMAIGDIIAERVKKDLNNPAAGDDLVQAAARTAAHELDAAKRLTPFVGSTNPKTGLRHKEAVDDLEKRTKRLVKEGYGTKNAYMKAQLYKIRKGDLAHHGSAPTEDKGSVGTAEERKGDTNHHGPADTPDKPRIEGPGCFVAKPAPTKTDDTQ